MNERSVAIQQKQTQLFSGLAKPIDKQKRQNKN
jgi:hypothetical protein